MFKILAVICFMQVGELKQELCFHSEVPLKFKTIEECSVAMNNLADYMDTDLVARSSSIAFFCRPKITPIDI